MYITLQYKWELVECICSSNIEHISKHSLSIIITSYFVPNIRKNIAICTMHKHVIVNMSSTHYIIIGKAHIWPSPYKTLKSATTSPHFISVVSSRETVEHTQVSGQI